MPTEHPEASSLTTLLVSVTRHLPHRWSRLTDRQTVSRAMAAATESPAELQILCACYPDPVLRDLRLTRLARALGVPETVVQTLLSRLATLPPRPRFPVSPEVGDWAWDRRRELFGRYHHPPHRSWRRGPRRDRPAL